MFLQSWTRTVKEQYKWLAPLLARVHWNIQSTTDKFDGDRQEVGWIALFVSVFYRLVSADLLHRLDSYPGWWLDACQVWSSEDIQKDRKGRGCWQMPNLPTSHRFPTSDASVLRHSETIYVNLYCNNTVTNAEDSHNVSYYRPAMAFFIFPLLHSIACK